MNQSPAESSHGNLRILQCIPSLVGGGAERQVGYLSTELAKLGHDVHVAYIHTGPNLERLLNSGATLHRLDVRNNHDPCLFFEMLRLCRSLSPSLMQTWMRQMDVVGGGVARLLRIPWILSERSSAGEYPPSLKYRLREKLARRATMIISNSRGGDNYWKSKLGDDLPRRIISNGLPLEEIREAGTLTQTGIAIPSGKRVILFSGRFVPVRNIRNILKALLKVLVSPEMVFVMCGDGPLRSSVDAWRREYRLEDQVILPGYVPERVLWQTMKNSDVFISPSFYEGNPNAVLEAMACGLPLVVSDIPEHREFLDESLARFAKPTNWEALADVVLKVLEEPEAARLRAAKAGVMVQGYSLNGMAQKYLQSYLDLIASRTVRLG